MKCNFLYFRIQNEKLKKVLLTKTSGPDGELYQLQYETVSRTQALLCFVSDRKVDDLKTVAVTVLNCKQNVSFIVFCKVVYFTKHFC